MSVGALAGRAAVYSHLLLRRAHEKWRAKIWREVDACTAAKDALADIQEKHRDIKKLERSIGQLHMPCNRCVIGHSFVSKY